MEILPKGFKIKLVFLMVLIFVGMIFEILGIGVLLPALTAILQPNILLENPEIKTFLSRLGLVNKSDITFFLLGLLVSIYLIKSAFLLWSNRWQNRTNSGLIETLSNDLYERYINQNYLFHVSKNSSEIIKIFQVDVNYFNTFLIAIIYLISEASIVISVVLSLCFIAPIGTLSILTTFAFFSSLYYVISKKLSSKWGVQREQNDKKLAKHWIETFSGIKEVMITNSLFKFSNLNKEMNFIKSKLAAKYLTFSQVPRYYLEMVTVLAFTVFIIVYINQGKQVETLIVTLGVFVAATLRILPSINRILTSLQQIKYYESSVDVIYKELNSLSKHNSNCQGINSRTITLERNLKLESVFFDYSKERLPLLQNVNLQVNKGDFIGIIGNSGSGKSTLINIIAGLISPDKGSILIDGKPLKTNDFYFWRSNIGYVSQHTFLLDSTIYENVAFGVPKADISKSRVTEALQDAQLMDFINTLPEGINTKVGERGVQFSGGQQQRIGIARALYRKPKLLILDEATSALDGDTENEIMNSIANLKQKTTIIMVTHRHSTLKNCTNIFSLKDGKLFANHKKPISVESK